MPETNRPGLVHRWSFSARRLSACIGNRYIKVDRRRLPVVVNDEPIWPLLQGEQLVPMTIEWDGTEVSRAMSPISADLSRCDSSEGSSDRSHDQSASPYRCTVHCPETIKDQAVQQQKRSGELSIRSNSLSGEVHDPEGDLKKRADPLRVPRGQSYWSVNIRMSDCRTAFSGRPIELTAWKGRPTHQIMADTALRYRAF